MLPALPTNDASTPDLSHTLSGDRRAHRSVWGRTIALLAAASILVAACTGGSESSSSQPSIPDVTVPIPTLPTGIATDFGDPPPIPDGPLSDEVLVALEQIFGPTLEDRVFDLTEREAMDVLGESGDVRLGWLFSDLLRFVFGEDTRPRISSNGNKVAGLQLIPDDDWQQYTNHLIAWDVPEPPGYLQWKKRLFTLVEPGWEPLFDESATDVDWRYVSWGGVFIDDRSFGDTERCPGGCIPAADNPPTTDAAGGDWYPDERIVFGVEINGEARAYPKHIMETREMVNDTLGGRDFGMPYCTLCGSAQVFFTDVVDGFERPILRTSGLLSRSNKVMYDLNSKSVFDTFLGDAVTGPLAEAGVVLPQASVAVTTWGAWKEAHPDTSILAEDLDFGRGFDPLRGRDDNGPIFPIGDVDPRLPIQEQVLGVTSPETGEPVAFHVPIAVARLTNGEAIEIDGVVLQRSGDGIKALDTNGNDIGGHQAFWFAWSQFEPDTKLWPSDF